LSKAGDEKRYVRAVEAAWSRLLGRPAVVSPREFEAIDSWRRRGIPLRVVLEVITAAGKHRAGRHPKALTALAHAVEEAWSAVADGRTGIVAADALPRRDEARRAWDEALARCGAGTPLHGLLSRLLVEEREGVPAAAIDAKLDEALPGLVSETVVGSARERAARDLDGFKSRMSDDAFRKTMARAVSDSLRQQLALPRLALSRRSDSR
jgi:hypothetical protein